MGKWIYYSFDWNWGEEFSISLWGPDNALAYMGEGEGKQKAGNVHIWFNWGLKLAVVEDGVGWAKTKKKEHNPFLGKSRVHGLAISTLSMVFLVGIPMLRTPIELKAHMITDLLERIQLRNILMETHGFGVARSSHALPMGSGPSVHQCGHQSRGPEPPRSGVFGGGDGTWLCFLLLSFVVLGIGPRMDCLIGKCSPTNQQPWYLIVL